MFAEEQTERLRQLEFLDRVCVNRTHRHTHTDAQFIELFFINQIKVEIVVRLI